MCISSGYFRIDYNEFNPGLFQRDSMVVNGWLLNSHMCLYDSEAFSFMSIVSNTDVYIMQHRILHAKNYSMWVVQRMKVLKWNWSVWYSSGEVGLPRFDGT